jgi:hypothetical protein
LTSWDIIGKITSRRNSARRSPRLDAPENEVLLDGDVVIYGVTLPNPEAICHMVMKVVVIPDRHGQGALLRELAQDRHICQNRCEINLTDSQMREQESDDIRQERS